MQVYTGLYCYIRCANKLPKLASESSVDFEYVDHSVIVIVKEFYFWLIYFRTLYIVSLGQKLVEYTGAWCLGHM